MEVRYEDFCMERCGMYLDKCEVMDIFGENVMCINCIHPEEDFFDWLKEKEIIKPS